MNQGFIILSLKDKTEGRDFILATTHLKAKNGTESETARNLQVLRHLRFLGNLNVLKVSQLLRRLDERQMALQNGKNVPIIVCGDFNAEPDSQSCLMMKRNDKFPFLSIWDFKVKAIEEPSPMTTFKWRPCGLAKRIIDYVWSKTLSFAFECICVSGSLQKAIWI